MCRVGKNGVRYVLSLARKDGVWTWVYTRFEHGRRGDENRWITATEAGVTKRVGQVQSHTFEAYESSFEEAREALVGFARRNGGTVCLEEFPSRSKWDPDSPCAPVMFKACCLEQRREDAEATYKAGWVVQLIWIEGIKRAERLCEGPCDCECFKAENRHSKEGVEL